MKRTCGCVTAMAVCLLAGLILPLSTMGDVVLAVPSTDLQMSGNTLMQTFGYGPDLDEVCSFSSGFNQSINQAVILDDSTEPWTTDSNVIMTPDEILLWGKNGSAFNQNGDPNVWGFSYNPANGRYYASIYRPLKDWTGSFCLPEQRIIAMFDANLPNGTGASVSNSGGNYLLTDPSATFITDGVSVGDRPTLALGAGLTAGTYSITEVISETTLRLDRNTGSSTGDVAYFLKLQPWVTLASIRTLFPAYYGADATIWPNNASAPGITPDGSTLYVRESKTSTVLGVSLLAPESISVFVSRQTLMDYVAAQVILGRLKPGTTNGFIDSNGTVADEIRVDTQGRVWIIESETDDILWTTDGTTLNTFLTSEEIYSHYQSLGLGITGVNENGLAIDQMGTVYWSDNTSPRAIYKAPACGGAENIRTVATNAEIVAAIGSSAGLMNFQIRGSQILFNEYSTDNVGAADMNTFDYGDYDGDVDADADDYNLLFPNCLAGPGVTTPPDICTSGVKEAFQWCDLDQDGDVDVHDYARFQVYSTGPL